MKDWKQILVAPSDSIYRTLEIIDRSALQIALVVDVKGCLLGASSVVGAGAVVMKDVREGVIVMGIPAKVVK